MSTAQNKASVRRLNAAMNKGDFSILPELFAPNYVFHTTPEVKGPEALKQSFTALRNAFPDYKEKIEHMVAEGEMVAVFYTLQGTFKGKYGDMAPTGKKMTITNAVLARFKGDKQVEAWQYIDSLEWYRQLGMPIPPA
ncbi:MAG TPA: ester cyclase [Dehalococcoidales bacterium]|nr:ester cyclase [Dehalococcoidales bacterium]